MPADLNDYFNNKKSSNNKNNGFNFDFNFNGFGKFSIPIYIIIFLIIVLVIMRPFVVINSGQVGIRSTFGKYDQEPLRAGFHIFIPMFQKIIVQDTRVRQINYASVEGANEGGGYANSGILRKNSISVLDSRGLSVSIDITVQYSLNAQNAPRTMAEWGLSWEEKIIDPVVRNVVRSAVGKFTAEELPMKRVEVATLIEEGIRKSIESQEGRPVSLQSVQLREIILPIKVKEQIERVQITKQEAERAKYEVERANQEALKKAALAEGTAKAAIIEAQGKADAVKIEADATAYANKEIAKSLDERVLRLKQIETQKQFNEALQVNKDAKIFLTPGGAVPNIWVDTKDKQINSSVKY